MFKAPTKHTTSQLKVSIHWNWNKNWVAFFVDCLMLVKIKQTIIYYMNKNAI